MSRLDGNNGEVFAANYLQAQGYNIISRNFHSRYGEIDLIASKDDKTVCFIEVKTRREGSMVSGTEAVTASKQRKIIKTALTWLQVKKSYMQPRFDVCVITTKDGLPTSCEYFEAAFDGSSYNA